MKIGKIKISDTLLKADNIMNIRPLFNKAIPIHIEHRFNHRDYIYTCISDEFEDIKNEIAIPFYNVEFLPHNNDEVAITITKQ